VHLTVSVLRYEKNARGYLGTGSGFLSEHLRRGARYRCFVQRATPFAAGDLAAQVIMVGPGTGSPVPRLSPGTRGRGRRRGRN